MLLKRFIAGLSAIQTLYQVHRLFLKLISNIQNKVAVAKRELKIKCFHGAEIRTFPGLKFAYVNQKI